MVIKLHIYKKLCYYLRLSVVVSYLQTVSVPMNYIVDKLLADFMVRSLFNFIYIRIFIYKICGMNLSINILSNL